MHLYVIRHAQSLNNALSESQREDDPGLTDLGHEQASTTAQWAQTVDLTRLISSPFRRTLQTAQHIRRAVGLKAQVWIDLHEQGGCQHGPDEDSFEGRPGMTDAQILESFAGFELADPIDHRGWWRSQRYETVEDSLVRAERVKQRLHEQFTHTDERVAVVTHGTFGKILIETLLERSPNAPIRGELYNAAVTRFEITPDETRMAFYNQIEHMPLSIVS